MFAARKVQGLIAGQDATLSVNVPHDPKWDMACESFVDFHSSRQSVFFGFFDGTRDLTDPQKDYSVITGEQVGGLYITQQASLGKDLPERLRWNMFGESFVDWHCNVSVFVKNRIFTKTLL